MCFTKRQGSNFDDNIADQDRSKRDIKKIATEPPSEQTPTTAPVTTPAMSPKIAIVIYTMYGHIAKMAESVKSGVEGAGGKATIFQVPETLPQNILDLMHAPAKPDYPIFSSEQMPEYDAFILGIPTRYGNMPAQWKAFWDSTGALWGSGALAGKYVSVFVSTAGPGGGQETTVLNSLSTFTHHGLIFVPLGYSHTFPQLSNLEEVHGGSPWGAGTFASSTGARQPTPLELEVAAIQGKAFYNIVSKVKF